MAEWTQEQINDFYALCENPETTVEMFCAALDECGGKFPPKSKKVDGKTTLQWFWQSASSRQNVNFIPFLKAKGIKVVDIVPTDKKMYGGTLHPATTLFSQNVLTLGSPENVRAREILFQIIEEFKDVELDWSLTLCKSLDAFPGDVELFEQIPLDVKDLPATDLSKVIIKGFESTHLANVRYLVECGLRPGAVLEAGSYKLPVLSTWSKESLDLAFELGVSPTSVKISAQRDVFVAALEKGVPTELALPVDRPARKQEAVRFLEAYELENVLDALKFDVREGAAVRGEYSLMSDELLAQLNEAGQLHYFLEGATGAFQSCGKEEVFGSPTFLARVMQLGYPGDWAAYAIPALQEVFVKPENIQKAWCNYFALLVQSEAPLDITVELGLTFPVLGLKARMESLSDELRQLLFQLKEKGVTFIAPDKVMKQFAKAEADWVLALFE